MLLVFSTDHLAYATIFKREGGLPAILPKPLSLPSAEEEEAEAEEEEEQEQVEARRKPGKREEEVVIGPV